MNFLTLTPALSHPMGEGGKCVEILGGSERAGSIQRLDLNEE